MTTKTDFAEVVAQMPELLQELETAPKHRVGDHPDLANVPGIYLFTHDDAPIYVGQSRRLRTRLRSHGAVNGSHNSASFAFLMARVAAGQPNGTREQLCADPEFAEKFQAARAQVAEMEVQVIALPCPIARTMFEMYAALELDTTEFNKFETH